MVDPALCNRPGQTNGRCNTATALNADQSRLNRHHPSIIILTLGDQQTFEQLRDAVGDRPVDIPMMIKYGSYPRYRLLVTYFLEKKGWSVDQLLQTRLTDDEANAIMRTDTKQ
jgi:hypothetical protein